MGWREHAEELKSELHKVNDRNSTLTERTWTLQHRVVELEAEVESQRATANSISQKELEETRKLLVATQEAKSEADQQAEAAITTLKSIRNQLAATQSELGKERHQTLKSKKHLDGKHVELQQAIVAAAAARKVAAKQASTITSLQKQLQNANRECARLQNLREKGLDKHYRDDEDDEEPECTRESPKVKVKQSPSQSGSVVHEMSAASTLSPGTDRPANHSSQATPAPIPKPSLTKPSASAIPPRAATFGHQVLAEPPIPPGQVKPSPRAAPKQTQNKARSSYAPDPVNIRRRSTHENIVVDQTGPETSNAGKSPTNPEEACRSLDELDELDRLIETANKKRRRSAQDGPDPKRRLNRAEKADEDELRMEAQEELAGLKINVQGFDQPPITTARSSRTQSSPDTAGQAEDFATAPMDFKFTAVCDWQEQGGPQRCYGQFFPSDDLVGAVAELWSRIEHVRNIWERRCGDDWQFDFVRRGSASAARPGGHVCVTSKCRRRRTFWGKGREGGRFACVGCARKGLPCFTYTWEGHGTRGEFQLLPLHDSDRIRPVVQDEEIRWWVNDDVELPDTEDEMEY